MKCLICGGDSIGEICNQCARMEKTIFQKEWTHKEGVALFKKTEDLRIAVSNLRISGRVYICDNAKGLNARVDNVAHYLMNVKECTQSTFQNKRTLMIVIESENRFTRYCYLPGFEAEDQLVNAIFDAKKKCAAIVEKMKGGGASIPEAVPASGDFNFAANDMNIINMDEEEVVQPAPQISVPEPAPIPAATSSDTVTYDTVALANIAEDISEFETKIKKLKVLRDNGILSDEEYEIEKKKLVSIF